MNDKAIVEHLKRYYDTTKYSLGYGSYTLDPNMHILIDSHID